MQVPAVNTINRSDIFALTPSEIQIIFHFIIADAQGVYRGYL